MQNSTLEQNIDFLLSVALYKCKNLEDAKDLTQQTLLAALVYLANNNKIEDMKGWLITVLNRKFYDLLRKKYKLPIACNGLFDIIDETDDINNIINCEDAEVIRRSIAYLSSLYREVIVRHYMKNETVEVIAGALHIPIGTVKSRLSVGRAHIKKGIERMENYTKLSYQPQELHVTNSGRCGLHGEPYSVVYDDLLAQNILILAYKEPLTVVQISKALGVPTAYVERTVKKLTDNELMKCIQSKVYTDFIIYTSHEKSQYIPAQKKLIEESFEIFWEPIHSGLKEIRKSEFYLRQNSHEKAKLEYYFTMNCLDYGVFNAGKKVYGEQVFTDRPNGGKWIAFGFVKTELAEKDETEGFGYSGERNYYLDNYLNCKTIAFHLYDTSLENKRYNHLKYDMDESDIMQLLYLISENINPPEAGYNVAFLENTPVLVECGILKMERDILSVDIPILKNNEYKEFCFIRNEVINHMCEGLDELLGNYLQNTKTSVPNHLTSVPGQKQYLQAMNCINMLIIYRAKELGHIFKDVNYPCPPMVLVVDK